MDSNLKQDFTRRLSQCNKGELIVIMYDIVFAYTQEAKKANTVDDYEAFKNAVRKAQVGIDTLIHALDFKYEISKDLYSIYLYCKNCLAKAIYQNRMDGIEETEKVLKSLYASFCEVAKTDTSEPLMVNTQHVYAGITYGKTTLNENCLEDNHRGFFA